MNMYCDCEVVKIKSESKKPGQHWHCNCDFGMNFLANSYFKYQISHDKTFKMRYTKDQLNSEWIYEVIVSPRMQTKNYKDFCLSNKQGS